MADGKYFLEKLLEIMKADVDLQATVTGGLRIYVSHYSATGNKYPQVSIWLDEGRSETIFPAGCYKLTVILWIEKNTKGPYLLSRTIVKELNRIVNRKASSLSEIDVGDNEGLRIARCVKDGGETIFNRQTGLYFSELIFDVVMSEDESFDPDDAGNKPWV